MLTIDNIFSYVDEATAQATLQGSKIELRQIQKVMDFLSQTAEQKGDRAAAERARRILGIAADALKRISH